MRAIERLDGALRRANRAVGLILGAVLVVMVIYILIDVVGRKIGWGSVGGTDEISGYVMAALASWGLACTLLERAHVRIDLIRQKCTEAGQAAMDLFAMIVTNAVILVIAVNCWPVLRATITHDSQANTALSTPLWIPQSIWFAGWVWFAFSATALSLLGIAYLATGRRAALARAIGIGSELEQ